MRGKSAYLREGGRGQKHAPRLRSRLRSSETTSNYVIRRNRFPPSGKCDLSFFDTMETNIDHSCITGPEGLTDLV